MPFLHRAKRQGDMSSQSQVSKRVETPPADSLADMIFVPGGEFRMGSDRHYPEEAPVHRVSVGAFWIDRAPVTNRQFRKFVNATKHVTFAEIPPDPKDYPGALPHMLKAGSLVFTPPQGAGRSQRLVAMVAVQVRRRLAEALWAAQLDQRARRPSCRARGLPRCGGLRALGGQGIADRGRVGVRGARRPRWRRIRLGRGTHACRKADGQHLAGGVPFSKPGAGRLRAHLAGHVLPAERLWDLRHDRQCVGVDHGLLVDPPPGRCAQGVLRAAKSARRAGSARATIRASRKSAFPARS